MVDFLWCVMSRRFRLCVLLAAVVLTNGASAAQSSYYGKYVGKLKTLHHAVSGEVYAVDARTLHIRDFTYDGEGPAAYFYAGESKSPNGNGFRVNDEKGTPNVLARYRKKHVTVTLPDNKTLKDIKWFSVWCDEFSVNFGDVRIPKNLDYPKPQKVDGLRGVHAVSSENIVVVDAQTLLIPSFSYDGEAPDAKFWVGRGAKPSPQGVRVSDENGKDSPLRRYDRKTIVLTLPGDLTVFDIGHFGVWCEAFTVDFGHVRLPRNLNVPPSLKMLGVSPQKRPRSLQQQFQPLEQQLVHQQNAFSGGAPRSQGFGEQTNTFYRDDTSFPATTYRPSVPFRRVVNDDSGYQLIPSISLDPSDTFLQQEQPPPHVQAYNNGYQTQADDARQFFPGQTDARANYYRDGDAQRRLDVLGQSERGFLRHAQY